MVHLHKNANTIFSYLKIVSLPIISSIQYGSIVIKSTDGVFVNTFANLGLSPEIVSALTEQGYQTPTPIQLAAIPKSLAGHDLLAAAQTGTGKTAAFMLPSLERLKRYTNTSTSPAMHPVRMLILTPTRELADQIDNNIRCYLKYLKLKHTVLFGGVPIDTQTQALREGCEIVVATVGRLLDHVQQKNIRLDKVEILVLDEADRMLDMGFIDDIRKIIKLIPKQRQTLLFSATFSQAIRKLAQDFMQNPEEISVAPENTTASSVEQHMIAIDTYRKKMLLERLIIDLEMNQVIVFCNTKNSVDQITRHLQHHDIQAESIHSDKSQFNRLEVLTHFKEGKIRVLVATDIAARGLDIAELPFVINYELPNNPEDYVHRIGRTGRANMAGVAISLMDEQEQKICEAIQTLIDTQFNIERIEGFEPSWWGRNSSASNIAPQNPASNQSNTSKKTPTHNATRGRKSISDTDITCQKIPGRNKRRFGRHTCALLQPEYGVLLPNNRNESLR